MNLNPVIENKVRPIFRSVVGLIFGMGLLELISSQVDNVNLTHPETHALNLVAVTLLFLYLSLPGLQKRLGAFYMPAALIGVTVILLVNQRIMQHQILMVALSSEPRFAALGSSILVSLGDSWVIFLFLPLVLIAWQYRFSRVLLFVAGTVILDSFLTLTIFGTDAEYLIVMFNTIVSRSIAFLVVGFIVVRLVTHQTKQQEELSIANARLSNYATVLEKFSVNVEQLATSYERNRLARELHDTLAHTLSALSVQLEATDTLWKTKPDKAQALLHDALGTTRSGLKETRRALQALRASPLEDLGLALAIRTLAESTANRDNFQLEIDIPAQLTDLNPQLEQTLYRVFQEALENISRHAGARHVTLNLTRHQGKITALVTDDGIGFSPSDVDNSKKLGLLGMRERVEMLGGKLDIQSAPGSGTRIQLTVSEGATV